VKAVKLSPNDCIHWNCLGLVYYRLGQYAAALESLEHSMRGSMGETAAINLFFLAMCHAHFHDHAKAKDCYERAVHLLEKQQDTLHPKWKDELDSIQAEAKARMSGSQQAVPQVPLPQHRPAPGHCRTLAH